MCSSEKKWNCATVGDESLGTIRKRKDKLRTTTTEYFTLTTTSSK